jgi:hypothetical protein
MVPGATKNASATPVTQQKRPRLRNFSGTCCRKNTHSNLGPLSTGDVPGTAGQDNEIEIAGILANEQLTSFVGGN